MGGHADRQPVSETTEEDVGPEREMRSMVSVSPRLLSSLDLCLTSRSKIRAGASAQFKLKPVFSPPKQIPPPEVDAPVLDDFRRLATTIDTARDDLEHGFGSAFLLPPTSIQKSPSSKDIKVKKDDGTPQPTVKLAITIPEKTLRVGDQGGFRLDSSVSREPKVSSDTKRSNLTLRDLLPKTLLSDSIEKNISSLSSPKLSHGKISQKLILFPSYCDDVSKKSKFGRGRDVDGTKTNPSLKVFH